MSGSQGQDLDLNGDLRCENAEIRGRLNVGGVPVGPASIAPLIDLSINAARVDQWPSLAVMRTGASVNPAGAFNGGGTGNKSVLGLRGWDGLPLSALSSVRVIWQNIVGPGGPFFFPPTAATVTTPYANFVINVGPPTTPDYRVVVLLDDGLHPSITAAIGTYTNPGNLNTLVYQWASSQAVCVVGAPPALLFGLVPVVSVGANWFENAYSWPQLVAAVPHARFADAYTADGGYASGAINTALALVSGDSSNVTKSGKRIIGWELNGQAVAL